MPYRVIRETVVKLSRSSHLLAQYASSFEVLIVLNIDHPLDETSHVLRSA